VIPLIVLASLLGVMVIAFGWFYWYSRTPAWGDSATRKAILNMLVMVGPMFGMHYRAPRPEPPSISTPGPDAASRPDVIIPPGNGEPEGDPR
jgi:hypothetical protein